MKIKLSEEVIAGEDLKSVIDELKAYKADFRHQQILLRVGSKHIQKGIKTVLSPPALNLLNQAKEGKALSVTEIDKLISELEGFYLKWPRIRVVLAASAPLAIKRKITKWVRENVLDSVLIDFRYDSAILGGMVVVVGSRIYDWSLRRDIEANKDKLSGQISHV